MVNHVIIVTNVVNAKMAKKNLVICLIKIAKNIAAFREDGKAKNFVRIMFHVVVMDAEIVKTIHSVPMIRSYRHVSMGRKSQMKNV